MNTIQLTEKAKLARLDVEREMRKRGYEKRGSIQDVINYSLVNLAEIVKRLDKESLDNILIDKSWK